MAVVDQHRLCVGMLETFARFSGHCRSIAARMSGFNVTDGNTNSRGGVWVIDCTPRQGYNIAVIMTLYRLTYVSRSATLHRAQGRSRDIGGDRAAPPGGGLYGARHLCAGARLLPLALYQRSQRDAARIHARCAERRADRRGAPGGCARDSPAVAQGRPHVEQRVSVERSVGDASRQC